MRARLDPKIISEARARYALSELLRRDGVDLLRRGREFVGRCPFHEEKTPSFTVLDDKGFYHCFGCGAHGDAIAWRMRMHREDFVAAVESLTGDKLKADCVLTPRPSVAPARMSDDGARIGFVRELWREAMAARGTLAESYLRCRGISLELPPTLRFSTQLRHAPSASAWPAIIAGVQAANGRLCGVHRTYLARDGQGKAPISPNKMMLGAVGGGAVRLARAGTELAIGEGIETCLAFMQETQISTWAALSTGGMRSVIVPALPLAARVYLVVDNDAAGESAADELARRLVREGHRVTLARAAAGKDVNDALLIAQRAVA
jgi:hypothetical protein